MRISDWSSDVCSSDLVLRQMQFDDVATARIDRYVKHVAAHTNKLAARRISRQGAGLLLAGNRGHIASGAFAVGGGAIRKSRYARLALRGFGRQGCLTVVLIPLKNHTVGNDS